MTTCTGTFAEEYALPYVEEILSEFEAERFEEHYFECADCLGDVQALLAAEQQLRLHPLELPAARPSSPLAWPSRLAALGAVAALLVVSVFTWRAVVPGPAQPHLAHTTQLAPAQTPSAPAKRAQAAAGASQLADLALPAFVATSLRGDSADASFDAGMKAYSHGNCRAALDALTQVAGDAREAGAASFYAGVCRLHLGQRTAAAQTLRTIANAGDSPQQEAALYYLAQLSLLNNGPAQAHRYLAQTIALRGDLEARARAQDLQVKQLIAHSTASVP
jgi:hypothetical protein